LSFPHSEIYVPCPTQRIEAPNPLITPAIISIIDITSFMNSVCGRVTGRIPHQTQIKKQKAPSCIAFKEPRDSMRGADRKLHTPKVMYKHDKE